MTILKPYPVYEDSGRESLSLIPDHWKVRRGKYVFRSIDIRSMSGEEELLSVSETDGVVPRREKTVTMFMAESYVGHKLCWPDDLVINSLWAWKKGLGFSKHHGIVSSAYGVYRLQQPEQHDPRYLHRALRSHMYDRELRVRSKGVWTSRLQLTDEAFLDMPLVLPPLDEQRAIADFLDGMDARITRFIAARRKMIALLEEKKQAVINQAVTRGLDPSVPMKNPGVDWLGELPAHWQVRTLKSMATVQTGLTLGKTYGAADQLEERPYIRVANVQAGRLDLSAITTIRVPSSEIHRTEVQDGDILMTEGGDIDKLGRGARWRNEVPGALHQNHVFAVRPDMAKLNPDYLVHLLSSRVGRTYFQITAKQTTNLAATNSTTLRNFPIPLPVALKDQQEIVEHIDRQALQIDALIGRHRREIELMQEYRTRLISDVVTGKLDVRGIELPAISEVIGEVIGEEVEAALEEEDESAELSVSYVQSISEGS